MHVMDAMQQRVNVQCAIHAMDLSTSHTGRGINEHGLDLVLLSSEEAS